MNTQPKSTQRDLILGMIRGYDFETLEPFIASLRHTTFSGEVVLFWNTIDVETRHSLETHGVKLIHIPHFGNGPENPWSRYWPFVRPLACLPIGDNARRLISKLFLNIATVRFIFALEFLQQRRTAYDRVLFTDVRDVLFQGDPFARWPGGDIVAFLEAPKMVFGNEPSFNDPWISRNYGLNQLQQLRGRRISCCGTVMGSTGGMIEYLSAFANEVPNLSSLAWGADTSIHNTLIHFVLKERITILENLAGAVATLGNETEAEIQLDSEGFVIGPTGHRVPVLHQYTEHLKEQIMSSLLSASGKSHALRKQLR